MAWTAVLTSPWAVTTITSAWGAGVAGELEEIEAIVGGVHAEVGDDEVEAAGSGGGGGAVVGEKAFSVGEVVGLFDAVAAAGPPGMRAMASAMTSAWAISSSTTRTRMAGVLLMRPSIGAAGRRRARGFREVEASGQKSEDFKAIPGKAFRFESLPFRTPPYRRIGPLEFDVDDGDERRLKTPSPSMAKQSGTVYGCSLGIRLGFAVG